LEIEKLKFVKRKYGRELLVDCSLFSKRKVILRKNPFILDFYGIYIITKGNGETLLDNSIIPFSKGFLLFFQPNQVRQWQNVSSDFDGYFLVFEKEFIETFFRDNFFIYRFQFFHNNNRAYCLKCKQDFLSSLINSCKLINTELDNLQEDSHHFLRSILYNILIQINRKFIEQYGLSTNLFQNNLGIQFKELLETSIRNYQRVEEYARFLKVSRTHLNNVSKKTFGSPVSVIIKERLLTEIKRDLLFTNKSIKEISLEMNFSDISNFIRFFKKHARINPNEYRFKFTK
jgi:AraC family transcriptional regulator, transcriptional activator of pobA